MKFGSSRALAQYLGCSYPAISRWIACGLPHKLRSGMHYEYDLEEVIGWLVAKSPRHRRWVEQLLVEIKNRESKEESVVANAE